MGQGAPKYIGIDIGGTKTRIILFENKKWRQLYKFSTPQKEKLFSSKLKSIISALAKKHGPAGVGIGTAGVVNRTTLVLSPNISAVRNFDFRSVVPKNIALKVDNDARCFARAELNGGLKNKKVFFLTIGTGIGRAYAERGKIKKMKRFEYPERWEKKYQKIRDSKDTNALAIFLGTHIVPLLKKFSPDTLLCTGGVLGRKNFFAEFRKELVRQTVRTSVMQSRSGDMAAARGAVLLFK